MADAVVDALERERKCQCCFAMFERKMNESPSKFRRRLYCDRKCSTRATAAKGLATKKRALLKY